MAADKSPAQNLFDGIVNRDVTSVLKTVGFRKSALNFHRRHGNVVQVVNLQLSVGSSWNQKQFYVNVGIAFDAICRLTNNEVLEKPKPHDCPARGTEDRLEGLVENACERWSVDANGAPAIEAQRLQNCMQSLATELQVLDDIGAYRRHRWFDRFRPKPENAQILYLLGDLDAARAEVQGLSALFADRINANRAAWWFERLGLSKLGEAE